MNKNLDFFKDVELIEGSLILENNKGFEEFAFLSKLKVINATLVKDSPLRINNNKGLLCLGMRKLRAIYGAPNMTIDITNRLRLCDGEILQQVFDGEIIYQWGLEDEAAVDDDTALGLVMIFGGMAILLFIVHGSAYVVYKWEDHQLQKKVSAL
ncbi:unnamed protein product [Strongylus vulgaris]|uniref:Receptor L-domain domain-containing protein n=1 Tax=Strongylus vulgaris TaxID=40348 RepID=A0A3P7J4E7_STRVU|nr:unnamed protein product [Strongylus vulgaris]